jgi:hypothetical protein
MFSIFNRFSLTAWVAGWSTSNTRVCSIPAMPESITSLLRKTDIGFTSWLLDETKVETYQKENEMNNGTHTTEFGRLDNASAHERHRKIGEIEIELYSTRSALVLPKFGPN